MAVIVASFGVAPHVAFSIEEGEATWFYNSYDEGYYGWTSLNRPVNHRLLAGIGVRVLTLASGGSLEHAMIVADFVLPFLVMLAACFAISTVTRTAMGMGTGGVVVGDGCGDIGVPERLFADISIVSVDRVGVAVFDPSGAGIFPQGNFTGVFWIFRTPEPQMTWIVVFILLGACAPFCPEEGAPLARGLRGILLAREHWLLASRLAGIWCVVFSRAWDCGSKTESWGTSVFRTRASGRGDHVQPRHRLGG